MFEKKSVRDATRQSHDPTATPNDVAVLHLAHASGSAPIAMVSVGQGAQASIQEQISSMGTNMLTIFSGSMNMGGVRSGAGSTSTNTFTVEDIEAIKRECPTVALATPSVVTSRPE